eukprot:scaffold2488_cov59-Isochrysis_galbana.AAC.2
MAASATSAAGAPLPAEHATSTSMLTGETDSGCACAGEQNVNKEGPRGGTEKKTRARVGGRPQGSRLVWASALVATRPDARGARGWGGEGACAWVECESLRGRRRSQGPALLALPSVRYSSSSCAGERWGGLSDTRRATKEGRGGEGMHRGRKAPTGGGWVGG